MDKLGRLTVEEINYHVAQLKPIEQVSVISNTLVLLDKNGQEIVDDENTEHKLNDTFYDSIKDDFRFVTKER